MSLESTSAGHLRTVWCNRDLRLLLGAGLVSQTGDWVLGTGIAFQVYVLTGSTVASAVVLLATQAPQVLFGSVAGVLVDRWDRRRVMVLVNLLLAVVLAPLLVVHDASQVWIIFAVVALSSCLTPFFVAAEVTMLPALVETDDLVTANAVNAQVRNVSRLAGAALGGVIIATGGLFWLALADVATFVLAALAIGMIRYRPARQAPEPLHLVRDWVEGVAVIRRSRALVVLLVFFAVSGIGEAVMGTLFAPFVHDVLGGSGTAFGTILSAQAVGGIVGGVLVTAAGHRFPPRALFGWGAVVFGLGDLVLFLYPLLPRTLLDSRAWPAVVVIALVGLPGAALFAGMLTLFQTSTDDQVRGRVYGALLAVQNLAMLASTVVAGTLAHRLGVVVVISAQGALYVLAGTMVLVVLRPTAAGPRSTAAAPRSAAAAEPGRGTDPARGMPQLELLDNPANSTRLPSMSLASNVRTGTITDPLALRALAHPVRVQVYELVGREGTATAADAARQLEISHALASHHLHQLAKYGYIEPAETSDQRARPWRVVSTSLQLRPTEPDARAAVDLLDRFNADRGARQLAEWQQRRAEADPAWAEAAGIRTGLLYLTATELAEVIDGWQQTLMELAERRPLGHAAQRPADTVPVSLTLVAVPIAPTEQGG